MQATGLTFPDSISMEMKQVITFGLVGKCMGQAVRVKLVSHSAPCTFVHSCIHSFINIIQCLPSARLCAN